MSRTGNAAAGLEASTGAAGEDEGQFAVIVSIAVIDAGSEDDGAVVEDRAGACRGGAQTLQEKSELL